MEVCCLLTLHYVLNWSITTHPVKSGIMKSVPLFWDQFYPPVCNRSRSQTNTWFFLQLKYIKAITDNLQCSVKHLVSTFFPRVLNVPFAWGLLVSQSNTHTHTHTHTQSHTVHPFPISPSTMFLPCVFFFLCCALLLSQSCFFPPPAGAISVSFRLIQTHTFTHTNILFPIYGGAHWYKTGCRANTPVPSVKYRTPNTMMTLQ